MVYQRIRYFLQAAESRSFSAAAEKMYISSQALTRQIGQLEKEIGGKLFTRSPHGIQLTELGQYAHARFSDLDRMMDNVMSDVKNFARDSRMNVRIGFFGALPREELVMPVLSYLLASYQDYQIGISMVEMEEGRHLLMDGHLDFLLTNTHEEDGWNDCRLWSFGAHEAKVIVSLVHPWATKDALTADDLRSETFLKMAVGGKYYRVPIKDSFYYNVPCRDSREVENFDTLQVMLHQGAGFAVFPMAFVHMKEARIKAFDFPGRKLMYHTALISRNTPTDSVLTVIAEDLAGEFELVPLPV